MFPKYLLSTFALGTMLNFCAAQGNKTISSILLDTNQDELVSVQREKLQQFNSLQFEMPFIRNVEVRTETNGFDLAKQEYLLRFSPNDIRTIKAQRQYQQAIKHITEMELNVAYTAALKDRYKSIIAYAHLQELLKKKQQVDDLQSDQILFFRRSMALEDFKILDLLKATDAAQENRREMLDLENELLNLESLVFYDQQGLKLDSLIFQKLPDVEDIIEIVYQIEDTSTLKHPRIEFRSAQLYSTMLEHEMETVSRKFSLGYFQVKYGYDQNDAFAQQVSIGAGFDLPLKRSNSIAQNRLQVEVLEGLSAHKREFNAVKEAAISSRLKLFNAIEKYRLVSRQLEKGEAEFVLQEYRKIADVSPIALLELREITLELEIMLCNLKFEVLENYLEYLDYSGYLSENPHINFLSKNMEALDN